MESSPHGDSMNIGIEIEEIIVDNSQVSGFGDCTSDVISEWVLN